MSQKRAIIMGAGPAGLTTAYELLQKTGIKPIIFEASDQIGGISKTIDYKGNLIDIGGHRFFSKSDRVMAWWGQILPIQKANEGSFLLQYQGKTKEINPCGDTGCDPETTDEVMLVRSRLSRIYYLKKFFSYPIKLEMQTIKNFGLWRMTKIGCSYIKASLFPLEEKSLEEFYVNRFGRELYNSLFRDYTEKVWGVKCSEIAPDWGAQRVKGLSIKKALLHALKQPFKKRGRAADISQSGTETSLIEYFLYPKYGPGQMWQTVAKKVQAAGAELHQNKVITQIHIEKNQVVAVEVLDAVTGQIETVMGDYFFSTMPVKELIAGIKGVDVPANVQEVAAGLPYRDFITVGLLMRKMKLESLHDNWIYIQEPEVKVGRLQIFNNWSPYMVKDPDTIWIGMEYFVNEGDALWTKSKEEMAQFGIKELEKIGVIDAKDVLDSTVIHEKKTYPAYFGTYNRFDEIRQFVDPIENLFLLGRNGMHRYNNQDHSMLTAMVAVENIVASRVNKDNLWDINTEQDYHEAKEGSQSDAA